MLHLRPFTAADVPFGMALKTRAGWNQREADWRRAHDLEPTGCFVAEWEGRPAGTAVTCVFGPVAWVAMVLVDPDLRGRGIGTALTKRALDFLDGVGVETVRLDATPLGRPIYEKLGFVPQFSLNRYDGLLTAGRESVPGVESVSPECYPDLYRLDREVTATDRRKMLSRWFAEEPSAVRAVRAGEWVAGFLTARPRSIALQIGPCLGTPEAVEALLYDAARRYAGQRVFLDVPVDHRPATALAERFGLAPARQLLRMCRGVPVRERLEALWISSGPEKG